MNTSWASESFVDIVAIVRSNRAAVVIILSPRTHLDLLRHSLRPQVQRKFERPKTLRPDSFAAEDSFSKDGRPYRGNISKWMEDVSPATTSSARLSEGPIHWGNEGKIEKGSWKSQRSGLRGRFQILCHSKSRKKDQSTLGKDPEGINTIDALR